MFHTTFIGVKVYFTTIYTITGAESEIGHGHFLFRLSPFLVHNYLPISFIPFSIDQNLISTLLDKQNTLTKLL